MSADSTFLTRQRPSVRILSEEEEEDLAKRALMFMAYPLSSILLPEEIIENRPYREVIRRVMSDFRQNEIDKLSKCAESSDICHIESDFRLVSPRDDELHDPETTGFESEEVELDLEEVKTEPLSMPKVLNHNFMPSMTSTEVVSMADVSPTSHYRLKANPFDVSAGGK